MPVVLRLDGVDELGRADQRRLGRLLRNFAEDSTGDLEGAVVMESDTHPDWKPGAACPECGAGEQSEWTVQSEEVKVDGDAVLCERRGSEEERIAVRCLGCDEWLHRTTAFDVLQGTKASFEG